MARKKIKSATDQRKFTLVYNDFLESDVLNYYEKMVFIALKKFANNDTMRAFPSLKTIHMTVVLLNQSCKSLLLKSKSFRQSTTASAIRFFNSVKNTLS